MTEGQTVIFGDSDFGFEITDIAAAREQEVENARVQAEMLVDENERVRRHAERSLEFSARKVAFFEAHDDETILGGLRYVFDRGRELEAAGLPFLDVALTMREEIPDMLTIGGILLERQTWGYRLFQNGIAANIRVGTVK